jgi:hypothetical protein
MSRGALGLHVPGPDGGFADSVASEAHETPPLRIGCGGASVSPTSVEEQP